MKYIDPSAHRASRPEVHPSQRQHHVCPVSAPLHVITVISNPMRYYARYKLYEGFEKMVSDAGAILWTVELALRDRHHEITQPDNPHHIQLRSPAILWHKENLINIGISRLPADWEYVAWIDADIQFARPDWAVETIQQLQIYKIVQMWSHSVDLGPDQQVIANCTSLIHNYIRDRNLLHPLGAGRTQSKVGRGNGLFATPDAPRDAYMAVRAMKGVEPGLMHTGYAWAARRSAINDLGRLGEISILGSGDRHMAYALLGEVERSYPPNLPPSYGEYWREWQHRAETYIRRSVGVVPGTILHYWHGSKQHRRYADRWHILTSNKFDHPRDLKKDPQGILQLTERNIQLRDDIINYFAVRNEDSIDL